MDDKPVKSVLPVISLFPKLPFIVQLPLVGDRPCLDLANTIDWRLRPTHLNDSLQEYSDLLAITLRLSLITVETYASLHASSLLLPQAAARTVFEVRRFRDAMCHIIDDIAGTPATPAQQTPDREDLAIFSAARRMAQKSELLIWKDNRMIYAPKIEEEGLDHPWLQFVRDADELFRSPLAARIKICAADGCGWAFLDTSKNGARRWCSMKICGNRVKAERFRSREIEG